MSDHKQKAQAVMTVSDEEVKPAAEPAWANVARLAQQREAACVRDAQRRTRASRKSLSELVTEELEVATVGSVPLPELLALLARVEKLDGASCTPAYSVGQVVSYTDQHDRTQTGKITRIEASWSGYSDEPLIVYAITHPSYRNSRAYLAERGIIALVSSS